ncbi:hypothetical protein SK128_019223 [Halocaridina rubra]|uniref:Uncharacterized protein n=1 Tax=Halocaridina rubra TaxID=373956 RepID=A0AAN8XDE7_HALRR
MGFVASSDAFCLRSDIDLQAPSLAYLAATKVWKPRSVGQDIKNTVNASELYQMLQPSQQQELLICDEKPTQPFESVFADFFSVAGKSSPSLTNSQGGLLS